jgi:hypothetical protein
MTLKAERVPPGGGFFDRARFLAMTTALHLTQPLFRLSGRLSHGLTPWRRLGLTGWTWPWASVVSVWSETWRDPADWVHLLREQLRGLGTRVFVSTPTDRWDVEARAGLLGGARALITVEEHGGGKQFVRFRIWPVLRFRSLSLGIVLFSVLSVLAFLDGATGAGLILGSLAAGAAILVGRKCGAAVATMRAVAKGLAEE